MDRKQYWNEEYTKYWKAVTDDANLEGKYTDIKKGKDGDYKAPGEKVLTDLFDIMEYEQKQKLLDYGCGVGRFFTYFICRG